LHTNKKRLALLFPKMSRRLAPATVASPSPSLLSLTVDSETAKRNATFEAMLAYQGAVGTMHDVEDINQTLLSKLAQKKTQKKRALLYTADGNTWDIQSLEYYNRMVMDRRQLAERDAFIVNLRINVKSYMLGAVSSLPMRFSVVPKMLAGKKIVGFDAILLSTSIAFEMNDEAIKYLFAYDPPSIATLLKESPDVMELYFLNPDKHSKLIFDAITAALVDSSMQYKEKMKEKMKQQKRIQKGKSYY